MDELFGYSYNGLGNGAVVIVVIYWVGCRGGVQEYSSNGWVSGWLVVLSPKTGKGSAHLENLTVISGCCASTVMSGMFAIFPVLFCG